MKRMFGAIRWKSAFPIVGIVCCAFFQSLDVACAGETRKPNVLIILADDMRADCLGVSNPHIRTPNLDRLASEGVLFNNCYFSGGNTPAVCQPSRTMLMTGCTLFHQPVDKGAEGNKPSRPAMPTIFGPAGYDTFYCGKHGNTYRPADRAFDRFTVIDAIEDLGKPFDDVVKHQRTFPDFVTAYLTEPARKEKSFFIFFAPSIPHDPLWPEPRDTALYGGDKLPPLPVTAATDHMSVAGFNLRDTNIRPYDVPQLGRFKTPIDLVQWREVNARYYAYVTTLDRQVGQILDALKRTGADSNTIVVFSSDNGHSQSDQGLIHKQSIYEQDIRVPMIVRGPGVPAGKRSDALVLLSDVLPTLCEMTGVKAPATVETRSFLPVLRDPARPHRDALYFGYCEEMRAYRDLQYKILLFDNGTVELYDLAADPLETRNLAKNPAQADRVAKMIALARKTAREQDDILADVKNVPPISREHFGAIVWTKSREKARSIEDAMFWTKFDAGAGRKTGTAAGT